MAVEVLVPMSQGNMDLYVDNVAGVFGVLPKAIKGNLVFVKAQFEQSVGQNKPFVPQGYRIVTPTMKIDLAGDPLDVNGVVVTNASEATQGVFFLVRKLGANTQHTFHTSELIDQTEMISLTGTEVGDWDFNLQP